MTKAESAEFDDNGSAEVIELSVPGLLLLHHHHHLLHF